MFFAKQHHKKGFTLAETILVVAIIAILLAVAAPNVLAYYRQLKLTGLDDDAKTIFMAAQSRLTAMLSAGEELEPAGPGSDEGESSESGVKFYYIDSSKYAGLHNYVPAGSIESQLQENNFIVEFVPRTGAVHAVWYWEKDNDNFTYKPDYDANAISRDTRLDEMVGYYGGKGIDRPALGQLPIPELNIINAEELRLDIKVSKEQIEKALSSGTALDYNVGIFTVDIYVNDASDPNGKMFKIISGETLDGGDSAYLTGSVVLGTLNPDKYNDTPQDIDGNGIYYIGGKKFKDWTDLDSGKYIIRGTDKTNSKYNADGVLAGNDITVTVVLNCKADVTLANGSTGRLISQSASARTNSLFAGLEDNGGGTKTALIAYGRHLQNLHDSDVSSHSEGSFSSGVYNNKAITAAKQIRDINFASVNPDTYNKPNPDPTKSANDIYYWGSTYPVDGESSAKGQDGFLNFHAINNNNLTAYDGQHYEIRNMYIVAESGFGGLFALVSGGDYNNITVVNPHVHGEPDPTGLTPGGSVGAIIGFAGGTVTINGCKVYSEYDNTKDLSTLKDLLKKTLDNTNIEAAPNGGCFVSDLLRVPHIECAESASSAGGLVGQSAGNISINNSFSSIPVVGELCAGGLVGNADDITISNSYSASFLYGNHNISGLVGQITGTVSMSNCYAAGEIKLANKVDGATWPVGSGLFGQGEASPATVDNIEDCYAAVKYVNTTGEATNLGGQVYGTYKMEPTDSHVSYYIADPDITVGYGNQEGGSTVECGKEISAADLIKEFESQSGWTVDIAKMVADGTLPAAAAAGGDKQTTFTHAYNLLKDMDLKVYPYPMLKTKIDIVNESGALVTGQEVPMEHYGDWVVGASGEPAAAYIEMYADSGSGDKRFGVYAAELHDAGMGTKRVSTVYNSLQDEVVLDDFYRFISPSMLASGTEFKLDDGTAVILGLDTVISADGKIKDVEGNEFYVYTLSNASGWDSAKNYYHKIEIVIGSETKTYLYNPSFACEAFDVTEYLNAATGNSVSDTEKLPKPGYNEFVRAGVTVDNQTDVYIRSARQLANIQKYTTDAGAPKDGTNVYGLGWTYEQLADIDFNAYDRDNRIGFTTGKTNNDATRLKPALLETGSYYGHQYTISNLYIGKGSATDGAGLFERVGSSTNHNATVHGVQMVNVNVKGENATATGGLVGILYGKVIDCGIYVENGTNVNTNYTTWTVSGTGDNGVGGLIGEINGGTAKTSFASVNVKGEAPATGDPAGPVGGFAGQITGKGTVDNCYAGGFVDEDTKTYSEKNANVTGEGSVGGFVGAAADGSIFTGVNYSTASVKGTDYEKLGLFAGNMNKPTTAGDRLLNAVAKAFVDTGEVAPRDESDYMGVSGNVTPETTVTTEVYNQDPSVEFPYPSGQTVHHGDWIEVEAMGIYYDTVTTATGSKMGYYANGKNIDGLDNLGTGTAGSGAVATDDGYMFVTEKDLGELSIKIDGKDFTLTKENISSSPLTINGKTYNYKYEVPAEALNTPTDNYYTAVSINGRIFYANFGAACEIFDTVDDVNEPMEKKDVDGLTDPYTGVVVRSARQLANIGIRSNVGTYAGNTKTYTKAAEAIQTADISQVLDIDYSKYDKDKIPEAAVLDGSNTNANHTPITIDGGSYDGHEYEIRNLVPGMIRQVSGVSGGNVTEALIESGLVGRITEGEIKNVTLINATVENDAKKAVDASSSGGGATSTTHTIEGNDWGATGSRTGSINSSDRYFTVVWGDGSSVEKDERNKYKNFTDDSSFVAERRVKFGGGASTSGRHVEFTTTEEKATVNIWWGCAGDYRYAGIMDSAGDWVYKTGEPIKDSNGNTTSGNPPYKKDSNHFNTYELTKAGTYYVGSTGSGNYIYKIEVIEHPATPGSGPTTPTNPGEDNFPSVAANRFKACFGTLLGVSLANPTDTADETVVIDNCGAYVVPVDATGNVITSPTTEQYTDSYNKFAVKNTGTSTADAVGGLIGMAGDGASIKSSYAAVKVEGNNVVGGFIGHLKNSTIQNCYSGGHTEMGMYNTTDYNVTARDTNKGYAGGFAGQIENSDTTDNLKFESVNYSTSSAKGGAKVGNFAGEIPALTATTKWSGFGDAKVYGIGAILGPTHTDERVYLDATVTMHAYNAADLVPAEPYDVDILKNGATGVTYPYIKTEGQKVHHGDWPMRYNLIYYELYKSVGTDFTDSSGNTLKNRDMTLNAADKSNLGNVASYMGFYGTFPDAGGTGSGRVVNTLRVDGTVYDSGYMVVSDANVENILMTINSYYVNGEDEEKNPGVTFGEDNQPLHSTTVRTTTKINFSTYEIPQGSTTETKNAADLIGKYGYIIPVEGLLLPAASQSFYLDTQINGQTYIFNPQFPCEAINVGIDHDVGGGRYEIDYDTIRTKAGINYVIKNADGTTELKTGPVDDLIIRTPLNLAGLTRFSRPSNNGYVKDKIIKYDFVQHMDVDYSDYAENHVYDGYTSNRSSAVKGPDGKTDELDELGNKQYIWYKTGQEGHGQVPAVLDGGEYDGLGHTIKNLYLQNDNASSQYVGLFGQLRNGAEVHDLVMENIHMTAHNMGTDDINKDNALINAGALAAVVDNATIKNVKINGVEISFKDGKIAKDSDGKWSGIRFDGVGGAIGNISGTTPTGAEPSASVTNLTVTTPKITVTIENQNDKKQLNVGGAIGEIDGGEATGTTPSVSVTNVTVTDPTITVTADSGDTFNTGTKVGGVIGSADGKTFDYSSTVTGTDTRSVTITDTGVYMSETNKSKFNDMGVSASGDKLSGDYSGGFAGYLGKGVNVTKDYAAIRVQGKTYAGGFAGQIEGSHVESCYSGGYVEPSGTNAGEYSTITFNVTAGTAGGFAGKIDLARQSTGSPNMALYMKGHNYTTSSAKGTSADGKFAGDFSNDDLEALNAKMGGDAPVLYAGGTVDGRETNTLTGVKTGSAMPRGTNTFQAAPYYDSLKGQNFPYATDLNHHHGDWVKVDLNAVGYWEVEDGKVRVWYIPADASDTPVTLHEAGVLDFDHDGRDAEAITASGYFVVSSNKSATFSDVPTTKMDLDKGYGKTIKDLLGGDSVAIEVYALNSSKSDNQTWTVNTETFTVNPAYGMAIEFGNASASTMGTSADKAYQIRTVGQLENMDGAENTMYFQQTHDIVFDSSTGSSYTSPTNFGANFNGGFYRIIDITKPVFSGLASGAKIDNVIVYAPEGYDSVTISGNGGIANSSSGTVSISNTIVAGFTISGSGNVGGLVGEVTGGSLTIKNSEATNTLTGTGSSNVGGLVGNVASGAALTIERSYAGGSITRARSAGGLVGAATGSVKYDNVYSYVNMLNANASTYYGIGLGDVNPDSELSDYWATGLDGKTAKDSDANIKGVTLAEMKLHTQAMDKNPDSVTVEEYLKPNTDRVEGLKNLAEGETDKFDVFPFAAFVTGDDTNYHYGDYPVAEYVGLYYYEKEVIFDAKNPMETNATTGKITNEDKARTEYNYYAYGGELFDADGDGTSEIYGQRVLDTLCYDHHLTGEYAYIAESGYGYFYPGAEGTFTATVKNFDNSGSELDKNEEKLTSGNAIRDNLLKKLGIAGTENFQVYTLKTSTGPRTETWTVAADTTKPNNFSGSVEMKVLTAFGAAIDSTFGNPDHGSDNYGMGSDKGEIPLQIRTIDQLQYLGEMDTTAGTSYRNIEYFGIKHDITGRKLEGEYKPYEVNVSRFNGFGYRIMDLNIEPVTGGAALFSTVDEGNSIENIILYSTDGKGRITSKDGNAAGILATTSKGSVTNCVVSGYTISGKNYVGGIIGEISGNRIPVINCQVIVTLDGMNSAKGIGGIAGYAQAKFAPNKKGEQGKIESCYAGGKIVNATSNTKVGGIFGEQKDMDNNPVTGCYSYMDLRDPTNNGTKYAIGQPNNNNNNIADTCYYLTEYATGASTTNQGTGQTFEEMCDRRTDDTTANYVYVPNGTDPIDGITSWGDAYPMAAVVKVGVHAGVDTGVAETGEVLVHYGEWPYCARAAGIAYWEKVGTEYIFKAVWVDHSGNIQKYTKDDGLFCIDHHVEPTTGEIKEHKIDDSGYVFFTSGGDMTIELPTHEVTTGTTTETVGVYADLSEAGDRDNVISALEKKLNVSCEDANTKVYSNKSFANASKTGVVDADCTVTLTKNGTAVEKTFYCNPGMSGVAEKSFADTYKTIEEPGGTKREVVDVASDLEIEIRTVEQLDNIPDNVAKGLHFKQTHDIYGGDYTSNKYTGAVSFAGTYDGQSYKILDLSMSGTEKHVGLFASINANTCELRNIIMYAPNGATISGTGTKGTTASSDHFGVGGLVGSISNGSSARAKIENCVVAGYTITGQQYVGGIVGWGYHGADIKNCAAVNDITCDAIALDLDKTNGADNCGAGGILGGYGSNSAKQTQITNCYVGGTIKVTGEGASYAIVGGIVGRDGNTGNHAIVQNCYTYADMSGCDTTANVYTISASANSSNKNNYYLNDSSLYPAFMTGKERMQGDAKSYSDLGEDSNWGTMFPTITNVKDPGKATNSYVTKDKSAGDTTSNDGMKEQTINFPFPEMVQDVSDPSKPVYVHYGEWPKDNAGTPSTSSIPWGDFGVFVTYGQTKLYAVGIVFSGSDTALTFTDRVGRSTETSKNGHVGLFVTHSLTADDLRAIAERVVIKFQPTTGDTIELKYGDLMKTENAFYSNNSSEFNGKTLYYTKDGGYVSSETTNFKISVELNGKSIGTFDWSKATPGSSSSITGAPGMPEGPSFEGMMSAAVPEEVTPEASALPVNELAGEAVAEGETEEILPPDTPEEVTPEASMLPENELAGEPVEEGETEEILPPDTPDAIKPEEFTLPDPEDTDDNGDDGHTEIIDIRMSVARVRRVR